jgi:hypothetical protein
MMPQSRPTAGQVVYLGAITRSDDPPEDLHRQQDGEPAGELTEFWLPVTLAVAAILMATGTLLIVGALLP